MGLLFMGLLFMGLVFMIPVLSSAEGIPSILIIPFDIHAEKDQSFLKPAITDMLYTRLSAEDRTIFVEKSVSRTEPVSTETAIAAGHQQNADYVLIGSITMLGTRISTDARLIEVAQKRPLLTFNEVGQDQGDIIAHMDHMTSQINASIFGVVKTLEPPSGADKSSDDIHIHPEKLAIPGLTPKTPPVPTPPAPTISVAPQADTGDISLSYWKSDIFSEAIQGISIADIDGDDARETLFITNKRVHVYRHQDGVLREIKTYTHASFKRIIRIDTADINQNGRAELFVTDYTASQQRLKSMVLEWNGQDFDIIGEWVGWYLCILKTPGSPPLLLGQKRGPGSSYASIHEALFDRDVYEMDWQEGYYKTTGKHTLPQGLSLYDFTRGDASNNGQEEIVAFSRDDHIMVYDQTGKVSWKSNEVYGGNRFFFEVPELDNARKTTYYYLPQRIHVSDIDGDGLNEMIVLKNHDTAGALSRIRAFKEGHIDCLSFDDLGVQLKWQTRKISGYISDYVIGDLNNDGKNEIVFSVIQKKKSLLNKGESYIVSCMPGK
jgi:TolB-like protein